MENSSTISVYERLSHGLLILAVVAIALTGFNSYYHADDFNSLRNILNKGFFGDAYFQYLNWDGRVVSPLFIIRNVLLFYFPLQVLVFLALLAIPVINYLVIRIMGQLDFFNKSKSVILPVLVLSILIWFGFRAHISRSVYWATGSYYMFANLLMFIGIYLYLIGKRDWVFLVITFTVMSSGVNTAAVMITFAFLFHVLNLYKVNLKSDFLFLLISVFGFLLSALAPGNFERARVNYSGVSYNVMDFPYNFWIVAREYILMSKWLPVVAVLAALCLSNLLTRKNNLRHISVVAIVFILSAFASIAPFMLVPESASRHTVIHFQTFLFIALFLLALVTLAYFQIVIKKWLSISVLTVVSVLLFMVAVQQFWIGRRVRKQVVERYEALENLRGNKEPVYLSPIDQPDNFFTNRGFDIKSPPDDINDILQNYFGTGSVRLKP